MSETPEIPEANDPFSKQVAITIALLAVVLAVIENKGDNAKTDAIIKTSNAMVMATCLLNGSFASGISGVSDMEEEGSKKFYPSGRRLKSNP